MFRTHFVQSLAARPSRTWECQNLGAKVPRARRPATTGNLNGPAQAVTRTFSLALTFRPFLWH
ncbi:MAG: hypothetical protein QOF70_4258 [Acetobacteraceae bacterium]|nr:hypothetical protein [Acetobacteraceae bacterium]